MKFLFYITLLLSASISCSQEIPQEPTLPSEINILFLGDSYTIGQSVCEACRYPAQLVDSLKIFSPTTAITYDIVAKTGWTTTNLISAISEAELDETYDFVYLLIGVNNQYQNKIFSLYEKEFVELIDYSKGKVNGNADRVNIVSIPDYAFTPFGQNGDINTISQELDAYNSFAKQEALQEEISFINITDISRQGLQDFSLVAADGLHPSTVQYTLWVQRILPIIKQELF